MVKNILNKDSLNFLTNYLNNPSPTGFESQGQKIWLDYTNIYKVLKSTPSFILFLQAMLDFITIL